MTNQTTLGLERQIGSFSGPYLDIGPDRDQVPKSAPFREHCIKITKNQQHHKNHQNLIFSMPSQTCPPYLNLPTADNDNGKDSSASTSLARDNLTTLSSPTSTTSLATEIKNIQAQPVFQAGWRRHHDQLRVQRQDPWLGLCFVYTQDTTSITRVRERDGITCI